MGFTSGHLLTDETGYLNMDGRKFVGWRDFKSIEEIGVELLQAFIYEAVVVDEKLARKRK